MDSLVTLLSSPNVVYHSGIVFMLAMLPRNMLTFLVLSGFSGEQNWSINSRSGSHAAVVHFIDTLPTVALRNVHNIN